MYQMSNRRKFIFSAILVFFVCASIFPANGLAMTDQTSAYRVYQATKIIQEFKHAKDAISYAEQFRNSHVESIHNREWIWDNYPKYQVYQNGKTNNDWGFSTLETAIKEAKKWNHASVRQLSTGGWIWDQYPEATYKVYQGHYSRSSWEFNSLDAAKKEANKWANSYILKKPSNEWVWDRISKESKETLRAGAPQYKVYQGEVSKLEWEFAYIEDAIRESLKWANSSIRSIKDNTLVISNQHTYTVWQNDKKIGSYLLINDAISYAKKWANSSILNEKQQEIWTNKPYYEVYQHDKLLARYNQTSEAINHARKYANASVVTLDGMKMWDNQRTLLYLGWNGSSADSTIRSHVTPTKGLDIDSPTWFELADRDGRITDNSSKETVQWLHAQGVEVHPLVHNQFDSKLTSEFLADAEAQTAFIQTLIKRLDTLGVDGLNLDFESLNGKDRDRFTNFVKNLTKAAHAKGLAVSIDLPRGDLSWNHLTAFDHAELANIVDYVVTMAYDQHYRGSDQPGSVSGLQWAEEGIQQFLSYGIRRDQLLLGIPFYVREWKVAANGELVSNRAIWMKEIPELMKQKNATKTWDATFSQYKVEYKEDGHTFVFWMEDQQTVEKRIELAKKYDLAGIAAWRLGYEPESLWDAIIKLK